jgi:heat shock protein HtpX
VRNQLKTLLLLGALSALLIGLGGMLGKTWLYAFTALALALNLGAWFFSDRVILRMHGAREIGPGEAPALHAMLAELAARAGIPQPRLFLIPSPDANAFATGRDPSRGVVAVTEGILRLLSPRELRGVLAHEIAHIANRDVLVASVAAALAAAISWLASAFQWSSLLGNRSDEGSGGSPLGALAWALVAPLGATLVQLGISRSREYLADEAGARLCGDPEALASALLRLERAALAGQDAAEAELAPQPATASLFIVNPLRGAGGLLRLFATHPSTQERVRRLRALAGFPDVSAPLWRRTPRVA